MKKYDETLKLREWYVKKAGRREVPVERNRQVVFIFERKNCIEHMIEMYLKLDNFDKAGQYAQDLIDMEGKPTARMTLFLVEIKVAELFKMKNVTGKDNLEKFRETRDKGVIMKLYKLQKYFRKSESRNKDYWKVRVMLFNIYAWLGENQPNDESDIFTKKDGTKEVKGTKGYWRDKLKESLERYAKNYQSNFGGKEKSSRNAILRLVYATDDLSKFSESSTPKIPINKKALYHLWYGKAKQDDKEKPEEGEKEKTKE